MKFLVLVSTITWSFNGGYQNTPTITQVVSPQRAAIMIWEQKQINKYLTEPDHKKYELYEIDLEHKTIKTVEIPDLYFKEEK